MLNPNPWLLFTIIIVIAFRQFRHLDKRWTGSRPIHKNNYKTHSPTTPANRFISFGHFISYGSLKCCTQTYYDHHHKPVCVCEWERKSIRLKFSIVTNLHWKSSFRFTEFNVQWKALIWEWNLPKQKKTNWCANTKPPRYKERKIENRMK